MRIVCAWCKAVIRPGGDLFTLESPTDPVSHGICPGCFKEQEKVLAHMGPVADHSTVMDHDVGGEDG